MEDSFSPYQQVGNIQTILSIITRTEAKTRLCGIVVVSRIDCIDNQRFQQCRTVRTDMILSIFTDSKAFKESNQSVGYIIMHRRQRMIIHILRRDDSVNGFHCRILIGNTRQRRVLSLKRDTATRYDGHSLGKQFTKLRSSLHREVFKEGGDVIYRAETEPLAVIRTCRYGFVRREVSRYYATILFPVARCGTVVARRCDDTLQEDVVVLLVAYLLSFFVLSVDVDFH